MGKVLVIEDNHDLRELVCRWLESADYTVRGASDGLAATPLLQWFKPDVVITDLYMPHKDGVETIAEVTANYPTTKVIAVSGGGERLTKLDYLSLTLTLGAMQIIRKPFEPDELLLAVHDALQH